MKKWIKKNIINPLQRFFTGFDETMGIDAFSHMSKKIYPILKSYKNKHYSYPGMEVAIYYKEEMTLKFGEEVVTSYMKTYSGSEEVCNWLIMKWEETVDKCCRVLST